jgi:hypothetical protein
LILIDRVDIQDYNWLWKLNLHVNVIGELRGSKTKRKRYRKREWELPWERDDQTPRGCLCHIEYVSATLKKKRRSRTQSYLLLHQSSSPLRK